MAEVHDDRLETPTPVNVTQRDQYGHPTLHQTEYQSHQPKTSGFHTIRTSFGNNSAITNDSTCSPDSAFSSLISPFPTYETPEDLISPDGKTGFHHDQISRPTTVTPSRTVSRHSPASTVTPPQTPVSKLARPAEVGRRSFSGATALDRRKDFLEPLGSLLPSNSTALTHHRSLVELSRSRARRRKSNERANRSLSVEKHTGLVDIYGLPDGAGDDTIKDMLRRMGLSDLPYHWRLKRHAATGERYVRLSLKDRAAVLNLLMCRRLLNGEADFDEVLFKKANMPPPVVRQKGAGGK